MLPDEGHCLRASVDAARYLQVLCARKFEPRTEHLRASLFNKPFPHGTDEYERRIMEMPNLYELPHHH